jgi:hypothetical protein
MQVRQLTHLAVGKGATRTLRAGRFTGMPHVIIDDQKLPAFENLQ